MAAEAVEKASADATPRGNPVSSGSEPSRGPLFKDEDDIFDFLRGELQVH